MALLRIEVRIFPLGQRKPIAKLDFDETTIGQLHQVIMQEVSKYVGGLFLRR